MYRTAQYIDPKIRDMRKNLVGRSYNVKFFSPVPREYNALPAQQALDRRIMRLPAKARYLSL